MSPKSSKHETPLGRVIYLKITLSGAVCATASYLLGSSLGGAIGLFIASLLLSLGIWAKPHWWLPCARFMNRIFNGIAASVSWLLLLLVFFLVLTPYGVLLRTLGHRPLQPGFEKESNSYWKPRQQTESKTDYLRQF